jgi:hypothetical protein
MFILDIFHVVFAGNEGMDCWSLLIKRKLLGSHYYQMHVEFLQDDR